jgi:quercetin dioxygenase-like cupin family protein
LSLRRKEDVVAEQVDKAVGTEIEWLISRKEGAPNFELRKFKIKVGGSIPKHYHPDIEHEQYVVKGEYTVGIDEKVLKVKPGDSLYIPAGAKHWYKNDGREDAEFLCVVPRKEKYDAVYVEENESKSSENCT